MDTRMVRWLVTVLLALPTLGSAAKLPKASVKHPLMKFSGSNQQFKKELRKAIASKYTAKCDGSNDLPTRIVLPIINSKYRVRIKCSGAKQDIVVTATMEQVDGFKLVRPKAIKVQITEGLSL